MADLTEQQRAYIDGLREMADFLENKPELIPTYGGVTEYLIESDRASFAQRALMLGNANKAASDHWYNVDRQFGPHTLQVTIQRDLVCERVVVGTVEETVEAPDPDAVAALPKVTQTVVTEKVEWRCPESLHELAESA